MDSDQEKFNRTGAHFAALCLRPSAIDPPPIGVLLKTKAEPQFNRAVTERSKPFFPVFRASIRLNFSLVFLFLLSGRQRVAKVKTPRGATTAALQTVIVPCRWPKARAL